jgi:hypothetical protein
VEESKAAAAVVHYAIAGSTGVLYAMALRTGMLKSRRSGAFSERECGCWATKCFCQRLE